jgi:hypothetical protein
MNHHFHHSNQASIHYKLLYPTPRTAAGRISAKITDPGVAYGPEFANLDRRGPDLTHPIAAINQQKSVKELVELMNTVPAVLDIPNDPNDFQYGTRARSWEAGTVGRNFRWDFTPVTEYQDEKRWSNSANTDKGLRNAIVYQYAPASENSEVAIGWALFVLGFVQAALAQETDPAQTYDETISYNVDRLRDFVNGGVQTMGYTPQDLDVIFDVAKGKNFKKTYLTLGDDRYGIGRNEGKAISDSLMKAEGWEDELESVGVTLRGFAIETSFREI